MASLAQTIKKSLNAGFNALGDVKVTLEYQSVVTVIRNTVSGYSSARVQQYQVEGVFGSFRQNETITGGEVNPTMDQKFICLQENLPATPTTRDTAKQIMGGQVKHWDVIGHKQDPAGATWVLGLRRRGGA